MNIRTSSIAETDIAEVADWLDRQTRGMGAQFLDAITATMIEIAKRPRGCPRVTLEGMKLKHEVRWLQTGRFPYLVIFHDSSDEVLVVAVLHAHRDLETILSKRVGVR